MEVLQHKHGNCIGNWRLVGTGEQRSVKCDVCESEYVASPENRIMAIDENYAGIYLRRLTAEGIAQSK